MQPLAQEFPSGSIKFYLTSSYNEYKTAIFCPALNRKVPRSPGTRWRWSNGDGQACGWRRGRPVRGPGLSTWRQLVVLWSLHPPREVTGRHHLAAPTGKAQVECAWHVKLDLELNLSTALMDFPITQRGKIPHGNPSWMACSSVIDSQWVLGLSN